MMIEKVSDGDKEYKPSLQEGIIKTAYLVRRE